jgi:hypothetical protein
MTNNLKNDLVKSLSKNIENIKNVNDLHELLVIVMERVSHLTSLDGKHKKELVMSVIMQLIDLTPLMKNSPKEVEFLLNHSIPPLIDLLVSASKNKWIFKRKHWKRCFNC